MLATFFLYALVLLAIFLVPFAPPSYPYFKYPVYENAPRVLFKKGEEANLKVETMTSKLTQMTRDYYSLPWIRPKGGITGDSRNLGEALTGSFIHNTDMKVRMGENEYCKILGRTEFSPADATRFRDAIEHDYRIRWVLDNIPSAAAINDEENKLQTTMYSSGGLVGKVRPNLTMGFPNYNGSGVTISNHLKISLAYLPVYKKDLAKLGLSADSFDNGKGDSTEHCSDGSVSGDETDVDCGGSCKSCELGQTCMHDADCVTSKCAEGKCASDESGHGGGRKLLSTDEPEVASAGDEVGEIVSGGESGGQEPQPTDRPTAEQAPDAHDDVPDGDHGGGEVGDDGYGEHHDGDYGGDNGGDNGGHGDGDHDDYHGDDHHDYHNEEDGNYKHDGYVEPEPMLGGYITGMLVEPLTVKHEYEGQWSADGATLDGRLTKCDLYYNEPMAPLDSRRGPLVVDQGPFPVEAIFTYDITWHVSEVGWDHRWELYLDMGGRYDETIHWYALGTALLALVVVGFFLLVGVSLSRRAAKKMGGLGMGSIRMRAPALSEEDPEGGGMSVGSNGSGDEGVVDLTGDDGADGGVGGGWLDQNVYDLAFTMPSSPGMCCVLLGTAAQLFVTAALTILLRALGLLSPSYRFGSLYSSVVFMR
jgi:hypothetical protein